MPFNIQGPELIVILIIALLVLGPGRLPEVGSALGKSIREFRKAASDVKDAVNLEPEKPKDGNAPTATATQTPAATATPVAAPIATAPPTDGPPAVAPNVPAEAPVASGTTSDADSRGS